MLQKTNRQWTPLALTLTVITMVSFLSTGLAFAYSSGPPNGRTGAPSESNCTGCHSTFPLNSGSGTLSVSGLSGDYTAGQSYDLVIGLDDPSASRWGFEFTIIGDDGTEIGTLTSLDNLTQLSSTATRTYAKQTSAGTRNGTTGGVTWNVRWTAPASGSGDAAIYVAGNAANGNFSSSGDRIYTISQSWSENNVSAAPLPLLAGAELKPNYPNPFNPRTTIAFELASEKPVRLSVYSLNGRLVRTLVDGTRGEGRHEIQWDGLDSHGLATPSGTYFYSLRANGVDQTRSMVLVR